jgi:hypothetical protein
MFGYNSYCNFKFKNITREDFYKKFLENYENKIKCKILQYLECDNDEYNFYKKQVSDLFEKFENDIINNNYHIYNKESLSQYHINILKKIFPDREYDNITIINSKNSHKLLSFMKNRMEDRYIVGLSFYKTITLYTDKIDYKTKIKEHYEINKLEVLFHELSHIYHGDNLFLHTINVIIDARIKNDNILRHELEFLDLCGKKIYNIDLYKEKFLNYENILNAMKLMDKWKVFYEIRADFESMFVLKETIEFQRYFPPRFNGYPTEYTFLVLYENYFPVKYRQDFLQGIKLDIENNSDQHDCVYNDNYDIDEITIIS